MDVRGDLVLIQPLELAIQTNHRNQRPAITLEQHRIDPRPAPAGLWERLQGQHAQGREIGAAVAQRGVMGRRPLALPDVELLIEWRCARSLATVEQHRCQQNDQACEKNHEKNLIPEIQKKGLSRPFVALLVTLLSHWLAGNDHLNFSVEEKSLSYA